MEALDVRVRRAVTTRARTGIYATQIQPTPCLPMTKAVGERGHHLAAFLNQMDATISGSPKTLYHCDANTYEHLGCNKCKQRRVKCDEGKPTCKRCQLGLYTCSYGVTLVAAERRALRPAPAPAPAPRDAPGSHAYPLLASPSSPLVSKSGEMLYFDHFRSVVVPQLAYESEGPPDFWARTVLRESSRDPGVLKGILAIGALSLAKQQAHGDDPLYKMQLFGGDHGLLHCHEAIRYYTQALQSFFGYVADTKRRTAARTILITTMLITTFELLQSNFEAVDRVSALCIHVVRDCLVQNEANKYASRIAAALDDGGVDDAALWLTRKVTLSAISSPIYPRGRESILLLAQRFMLGPEPPKNDNDLETYFKAWYRFFNSLVYWYLRAQHLMADGMCENTLKRLIDEQRLVVQRLATWISTIDGSLGRTSNSAEIMGYRTILLGTKVLDLCCQCCLDDTGTLWYVHRGTWDTIKALVCSILGSLHPHPSNSIALSNCLVFGLLQVARDCRCAAIRTDAIELCKRSLLDWSDHDIRAFVMGNSTLR